MPSYLACRWPSHTSVETSWNRNQQTRTGNIWKLNAETRLLRLQELMLGGSQQLLPEGWSCGYLVDRWPHKWCFPSPTNQEKPVGFKTKLSSAVLSRHLRILRRGHLQLFWRFGSLILTQTPGRIRTNDKSISSCISVNLSDIYYDIPPYPICIPWSSHMLWLQLAIVSHSAPTKSAHLCSGLLRPPFGARHSGFPHHIPTRSALKSVQICLNPSLNRNENIHLYHLLRNSEFLKWC